MRPLAYQDVYPVLREAMPLGAAPRAAKVAVLGGTGFIGGRVVRALVEAGYAVRCGAHRVAPPQEEDGFITYVRCDSADPASLAELVKGVDVVVYAAGLTTASGHSPWKTYLEQNVDSSLAVVRACREAGVRRLIYLGSQAAHAAAEGRYGYSKHLAERAVECSGLDWVLLKPGQVIGQKGLVNTLFALSTLMPVFPVLAGTPANLELVGVDEIAAYIIRLIEDPSLEPCQVVHLGSAQRLDFGQLLELLWKRKGKRPKLVVRLPRWCFSLGVGAASLLGLRVPLTGQVMDGLYTPLPPEAPARRACDEAPMRVLERYL